MSNAISTARPGGKHGTCHAWIDLRRPSMKTLVALLLLLLMPAARAVAPSVGSMCQAHETTYFSCATARPRTLSLCGAVPADLQYRYGEASHAELQFPDDASKGTSQLRYAQYSRYQTERAEVTFSRTDTDYAVFDYTEHGRRPCRRACHDRGWQGRGNPLRRPGRREAGHIAAEPALRQRQCTQWRPVSLSRRRVRRCTASAVSDPGWNADGVARARSDGPASRRCGRSSRRAIPGTHRRRAHRV